MSSFNWFENLLLDHPFVTTMVILVIIGLVVGVFSLLHS